METQIEDRESFRSVAKKSPQEWKYAAESKPMHMGISKRIHQHRRLNSNKSACNSHKTTDFHYIERHSK